MICLSYVRYMPVEQYGMYVCDGETNTALPGVQIYILGHGQYWYACEGKVVARGAEDSPKLLSHAGCVL